MLDERRLMQAYMPETRSSALPLIDDLHDAMGTPLRTWSLALSFLGDCIAPRGGNVGLGVVSAVLAACGVDPAVVRTSLSRLANEGWVIREKRGRNSFYALTPMALQQSLAASSRIYADTYPQEPCGWRLYLTHGFSADERRRARALFARYGAGVLGGNVHVLPDSIVLREPFCGLTLPVSPLSLEEARALVRDAFTLGPIEADYSAFNAAWAPVLEKLDSGYRPSSLDALTLRVLALHHFRRIVLRDPSIPALYLAEDWPGFCARATARALWRGLFAYSEQWLDENAFSAEGALPPRDVNVLSFGERVPLGGRSPLKRKQAP